MKHRLIGAVLLSVSAGMAYISLIQPLMQAQSGKLTVMNGDKVIMLLPLSLIVAAGLLVKGESFFRLISNESGTQFTTTGWILCGISLALGLAANLWYVRILQSLGYHGVAS